MPNIDALRSATSVDARVLHMESALARKNGLFGDLIAVEGDRQKTFGLPACGS